MLDPLESRENSEGEATFCDLKIGCSGKERAENYKASNFPREAGSA
jgi:hypothetical protein